MGKIFLKILLISFLTFCVKSILDILLQWMLISVEVREHIWGKFSRSLGYIWYDFILHFWVYLLVSFLIYFVLLFSNKIQFWVLYVFSFFIVSLICFDFHSYEFPMKQLYFPPKKVFNYILLKEIIVFTLSLIFMIKIINALILLSKGKQIT